MLLHAKGKGKLLMTIIDSRCVKTRLMEFDSQNIAKSDRKTMNFARVADQAFAKNPKLEFFTYKAQKNALFAVRWGLVGDFILIFRLKDGPMLYGTKRKFQTHLGENTVSRLDYEKAEVN
jgi:hypothetical protein